MKLYNGDCLEVMKKLPDNSVDSIVTDPPYGLKFMGKKWDYEIPSVEIWQEAIRVLKPGGHLLSFGGSRTYHRMAVNIEDAGFEIRDQIMWVYGSGFPKSHNIGKSVDKLQGNEREFVSENPANRPYNLIKGETSTGWKSPPRPDKDKGTSPYEGWGTALKPAHEPVCMARKPLSEKTIAENVLKWGTGGINIGKCRVEATSEKDLKDIRSERPSKTSNANEYSLNHGGLEGMDRSNRQHVTGRFPANFIHDGSDEVVGLFPETKGSKGSGLTQTKARSWKNTSVAGINRVGHDDNGSASRFFYCAKASKRDRNEGLLEGETSTHPCVKPTSLMQYLVRLVTPKGGTVLDPFMGSGSTGKACVLEGFDFIGIELDPEYCKIAEARIEYEVGNP